MKIQSIMTLLSNLWDLVIVTFTSFRSYQVRFIHLLGRLLTQSLTSLFSYLGTKEVISLNKQSEEEVQPYKPLPNVSKFKIKWLSNYHPIFLAKGILKREKSPQFEIEIHTNKNINRYINHQLNRLRKHRENPQVFWIIAKYLLNSYTFQVACFHHVFRNWHRTLHFKKVLRILKETAQLAKDLTNGKLQPIDFKRLYILKDVNNLEKGFRPLGVPAPHWRVLLHGLNLIMIIYFGPYQSPNQHGFWPGRGTDTAWKQIHSEVLVSNNIYEFDLKSFFDTINLTYLNQILESIGLPEELLKMIDVMSRSLPKSEQSDAPPGVSFPTWLNNQEHYEDVIHYYTNQRLELSNPLLYILGKLFYHLQLIFEPRLANFEFLRGVPQGSPLSPLLSSIALHATLLKCPTLVQYADDGILYDVENPEEILSFPASSGIKLNALKSQWIKRNGEWLTSLKFLGKRFIPRNLLTGEQLNLQMAQDGILETATRTPKVFVFEDYALIQEAVIYDMKQSTTSIHQPELTPDFQEWFNSKYLGFVSSRIYNGTIDISQIEQDFEYSFKKGTWSQYESEKPDKVELTVFNSTSIAISALLSYHGNVQVWKHFVNSNREKYINPLRKGPWMTPYSRGYHTQASPIPMTPISIWLLSWKGQLLLTILSIIIVTII